ncbi:MAG: alpha/beta fold hydrolase [Thiolinea sp.]
MRTTSSRRENSARKGILPGKEMATFFAWMRPNDLVWNYWINNYLLGNKPPKFDVLYWNADTTNLPAAFHGQLLDMIKTNPLVNSGTLQVLGEPVNLSSIKCDFYSLAGTTDHITPWDACYRSTRLLGGKVRFVLSNSGHVQSILNPPSNKKALYFTQDEATENPQDWKAGATEHAGSWWLDWREWLGSRSGNQVNAPATLGNKAYPPGLDAPGSYVFE